MPIPDPDPERTRAAARRPPRPLREVLVVMGKLGTIAFGGPAVHVAMLREETVRRRRWLEDAEFLDLFGAVSVLPDPASSIHTCGLVPASDVHWLAQRSRGGGRPRRNPGRYAPARQ